MSRQPPGFVAGACELPDRVVPDRSTADLHVEAALGALDDARLDLRDVDGLFSASAPGFGALTLAEHLGAECRFVDDSELGGAAPLGLVGRAVLAIEAGKCRVALVTCGGRPRSEKIAPGASGRTPDAPQYAFEQFCGMTNPAGYALVAARHAHEYGTTSEQLAEVKVAASLHARHNPNAYLPDVVSVDDVVSSPMIADPLHRLDCCVITDGAGALVVVAPDVARALDRHCVAVLGHGESLKHASGGRVDLTATGATRSGPAAFADAGLDPADVDYVSIYDSFTITVVEALEDLGFCEKGEGGPFVASGALRAPDGALPFNTDGGSLCNAHPANRGGMGKALEAVRQLRGEAQPAVQVPDCEVALAHGTGGNLATRSTAVTVLLGRGE